MQDVFDDKVRPELNVGDVLTNGFAIGLKNALSLIGATILWMLTIWIPYLNVGTTIALFSMPVAMSKGNVVSPMEIFDGKYRQYMGEFFLLTGLRSLMVMPGFMFMFIPGIIMWITYSMGLYIMMDKHVEPAKALAMSNKMTHGNKMTMFLSKLALAAPFVVFALLGTILPSILVNLLGFILLLYVIVLIPISLGLDAYIYSELSKSEIED
jgi:uncharacterized membrane protein